MDRTQLKQRLVGAAVLAAVALIVIPFVLNFGYERSWWGHSSLMPEPPQPGLVSRVLPLKESGDQAESPATGVGAREKSPPPTRQAPPNPTPAPIVEGPLRPPPSKTATATVSTSGPSATAPEAWAVQLGSFSSKKNADDLQAFLAKKGFRAFVDHSIQAGDSVYRVRLGPEGARARADTLRERVERETQLRAIVLRYP